ncbi:MAG: hypothetical protein ACYC3L_07100 [Gemmatimonadaceae bacterium]
MPRRIPLLLLAAAACARSPQGPVPRTEFLLANADSTFWVTADARGIRMRGAPLMLGRVDGRFQEIYVADDDRSYYDAVFVGQHIFRRDLISGDSAELLADGEVGELADRFSKEHPEERPLGPDEDGAEHPRTYAAAELRVIDVHGPYASYEHLTDIDITGGMTRHAAHRGVIDLRNGDEMTVSGLFGERDGERAESRGQAAWQAVRDSLQLGAGTMRGDAALRALEHFDFNAGSFTIASQGRRPQVRFAVPGSGGRAGGLTLPLPPVSVVAPRWWAEVSEGLPLGQPTSLRWPREHFELVARTDTAGERATLALRDGTHEWPVGVVQGPLRRVYWLDAPALSRDARQALGRAFDAAALYSEQTRIVRGPSPAARAGAVASNASRRARRAPATRRSRTPSARDS